MGRDPLLGRGHLLLGRQNLDYSSILVVNGSPNCVLFCYVGRHLPGAENHWCRGCIHYHQCYVVLVRFWEELSINDVTIFKEIVGYKNIDYLTKI